MLKWTTVKGILSLTLFLTYKCSVTYDTPLLFCWVLKYFTIRSKNENDQDDNDKEFIWKSPEEIEEEELNRIRESIEKFKKKSEQQSELISQDKGKGNFFRLPLNLVCVNGSFTESCN